MKKKILISGFEPFLAHDLNPSEWLVQQLNGLIVEEMEVSSIVLPVAFDRASHILIEKIKYEEPVAIIMFGLAANRGEITPERVAINVMDGEVDNDGKRKQDETIIEGGPTAYFSTLPIRKIVHVANEMNFAASISNTAGTYVCNSLMYNVLHYLDQMKQPILAGFIHIPIVNDKTELSPDKLLATTTEIVKEIALTIQTTSVSK
ncbi:pyrrolidone-carboxylate peptidase [Bacillus sp. JCM 19046]|nr:pyrrolidone-carboxylate peptidase [Bacillus sp. JCM 19045]GAF18440.1 pyrrolidone-carboxylate peptidase [Bacillus sp. JCM 19046]